MLNMSNFLIHYSKKLSNAINADYIDNYDHDRFGPLTVPTARRIKHLLKKLIQKIGFSQTNQATWVFEKGIAFVAPHLGQLENLYQCLNDEESKQILVDLSAFRAIGHEKIRLSLNTKAHWNHHRTAESLVIESQPLHAVKMPWLLQKMSLESIGYPITIFLRPPAVVTLFIEQQYRCETSNGNIECETGDTVIDAGGCWGDTALYFAEKVGPKGSVLSFEFLRENLEIFDRNINLNPDLRNRIRVCKKALWSVSNEILSFSNSGPGTSINPQTTDIELEKVESITIDDFVKEEQIQSIEFIKMDIEGAELQALRGAETTIKSFRPKLAITIYHSYSDFWEIPLFLSSLNQGYVFYIRHFKIHQEETVLFAHVI